MSLFLDKCTEIDFLTDLTWDGVSASCWCSVKNNGSDYEIRTDIRDLNVLWMYAEQMLRVMSSVPRTGRETAKRLKDAVYRSYYRETAGPVWVVSEALMAWSRWTETSLEVRLPGKDPTVLVSGSTMGASFTFEQLELNAPRFAAAWAMCAPLNAGKEEITILLKALLTEPLCRVSGENDRSNLQSQLASAHALGLSADEIAMALQVSQHSSAVIPLPTLTMDT